jgi:hypothetical protein
VVRARSFGGRVSRSRCESCWVKQTATELWVWWLCMFAPGGFERRFERMLARQHGDAVLAELSEAERATRLIGPLLVSPAQPSRPDAPEFGGWCLMTRDKAEPGAVRVGPFWNGVEGRASIPPHRRSENAERKSSYLT